VTTGGDRRQSGSRVGAERVQRDTLRPPSAWSPSSEQSPCCHLSILRLFSVGLSDARLHPLLAAEFSAIKLAALLTLAVYSFPSSPDPTKTICCNKSTSDTSSSSWKHPFQARINIDERAFRPEACVHPATPPTAKAPRLTLSLLTR
jgi:hypothetical protein